MRAVCIPVINSCAVRLEASSLQLSAPESDTTSGSNIDYNGNTTSGSNINYNGNTTSGSNIDYNGNTTSGSNIDYNGNTTSGSNINNNGNTFKLFFHLRHPPPGKHLP